MTSQEHETEGELLQELHHLRREAAEPERAEHARIDSERQLRELFENLPVGAYRTAPDGHIMMANPALVRMLGYSSFDELAQRNLEQEGFDPRHPRSEFKECIERRGKVIGLESAWLRKDGSVLFVVEHARAVRDETGKTLYYEGTVEDVTERKKAEEELRKARERLEYILRTSPAITYTCEVSGDWRTTFMGANIRDQFGYEPQQFLRDPSFWSARIHPDDRERVLAEFSRVSEERLVVLEYRFRHADGSYRWVHDEPRLVRDEAGKPLECVGYCTDVTKRKKAEQALRQSEADYRDLVEEMTDVIYTLDTKGNVTSVNKAGKAMFGRDPEEVIGKNFANWIPAEELPNAMVIFERILRGEKLTAETVLLDKTGKAHNVEFSSTPIVRSGQVVGTRGIIRDITQRKQAEQKLKESEKALKSMVNAVTECALLIETNGTVVVINEAAAERLDKSVDELIGKNVYDFLPAEFAELRRSQADEVIETGKPVVFEEDRLGTNIHNSIYPIKASDGQVVRLAIFGLDVTERKQTEDALRQSESKYRTLLENLPQGIFLKDTSSVYISCNENLARDLKIEPDQIVGKTDYDFLPKELAQKCRADDQRILKSGQTTWLEERYTRDGQELIVETVKTPVRDEQGNVIGILGIFWDITEKKKAEDEIRKLSSAVEQSIDGIAIGDLEPRLLYVNGAFARMHGYSPEEMVGMPVVKLRNRGQMAALRKAIHQVKTQGAWEGEIGHIRRDGTPLPVYMSVTLLKNDRGEPTGILAVVRDITQSKQREKELSAYREKMVRAEQLASLGSLSATLAHELTQPLTAIRLSIENSLTQLEAARCADAVVEDLKDGLDGVANAASIVDRLRNFARVSSEKSLNKLELRIVADKVVNLLQKSARQARVRVRLQNMDKLPPIYAHARDMEQLFFALVDNAIQAADGTRDRQLAITGVAKHERIELRFSDDCSGIAPENLDKIFQPFFTTKPPGEGTGLGLSVVEHIVSRAGGRVCVESQPNKGSTFFVTLPISRDGKS